ncbi:hypothetical protein ANN_03920 [Periplaneta americana]|uniref:Nuclease HARBI1 n=1 Tax=Periplaneta americana TaxID=6978 RepID=A0ABQ8T748_PERAM|nr:hypothetical protein ANN_03920 [Periplaneta americana]
MIGVWKRRFPVLSLGLRTKRQTTWTIIVATTVLHNIAVETRDQLPPEDLTLHQYITERRRNRHIRNQNLVPIHVEIEQTAAAYRNAFAEQHFGYNINLKVNIVHESDSPPRVLLLRLQYHKTLLPVLL